MNQCTTHIFKALSDETRFAIVKFLAQKKEALCQDISEQFPELSQPTMSHHFKILCEAGIVQFQKEGTRNSYTLDTARLKACGIDVTKWV
jgi:ArsR family transcriptional regulator, arsenate/arsenite/antimonite-responsive transcriptional repressor